jgi:hypothetical protein
MKRRKNRDKELDCTQNELNAYVRKKQKELLALKMATVITAETSDNVTAAACGGL